MFGLSVFIIQYSSFHHSISEFCGPHSKLLCLDEFPNSIFVTQFSKKWDWVTKIENNFQLFSIFERRVTWQYCKYMHLCGTRIRDMSTSSPQHQRLSLSLYPFSFFFPLSPSPNNKPTFFHKFFTPFSLVLSIFFPFAYEEQQYLGKDLHLKENPKTQQLWRMKPSNQRLPESLHLKENLET